MPVNLSKLPNLFFQIVKYLVYKKISKGETCVLTQFLKSPIHRDKGSHVFIPHKIILFLNCKMYLSKLLNVFVQIAERQNSNTISFVFHWQRQNGKNIVSWSVTRSVILNSHLQIFSKEYMMLLYLKDSALSMCHFTLAFLHRVISNVSWNRLPERMHTHTGCICFAFLHCAFSNVSSNCLGQRMHNHTGCICLTFLHCVFSNV